MFIQVVTGKVVDAAKFDEVGRRWDTDVRPAARGYLGGTVGTTPDGRFFVSSRWESADAANENNDRPEQTKWFGELAPSVSDVRYINCSKVGLMLGGGKDDAGFVQVMVGTIKDRAKFESLLGRFDEMEKAFSKWRQDVIGEVMAVHDDDDGFHDIIYFTSEADARASEKIEPPADVQALMAEMDAVSDTVDYLDLTQLMIS